jgi:imidazolonepropionase-like amidohydrolase
VILPEDLIHRETDPLTGEIRETFVGKRFADAGLVFALSPGPDASLPERMLTYQAARCVRYGVPRDIALRAITTYPAQALGVADRLGSIEPGKNASLVVFSGDPLDFDSADGVLAYERSKDARLQRLLSGQTEPQAPQEDNHESQ